MNFPNVIEGTCPIPIGNGNNPDVLILVLKPGTATGCAGSIQFQGFLQSQITGETALTSGVVFQSSNVAVVAIDSTTGLAVLISAGQATITAAYGLLSAQSVVTVQGTGSDCCETVVVATEVAVDNSKSMSQLMSGGLARLDFAKQAAKKFFGATRWDKDTAGLMRFSSSPILIQAISSTAIENATVDGIPQTINQTDILAGLLVAIAAVSGVTADRRVILLASDGEHRPLPNGTIPSTAAVLAAAGTFKSGGGIIIGVGCAAAGDGYALMQSLATPGFFVNAYDATTAAAALQELGAMLCYYCAGTDSNCCLAQTDGENLVPQMTSYTAPSGEASTGGRIDETNGWKVFDRDEDTYWLGDSPFGLVPDREWLQYQFPTATTIARYAMKAPYTLVNQYVPTGWIFQGSADGVAWTTLDTRATVVNWQDNVTNTFELSEPQTYAYFRITFQTAGNNAGGSVGILGTFAVSELELIGGTCTIVRPDAQVPNPIPLPDTEISSAPLFVSTQTACVNCGAGDNAVPVMTSNTAPLGTASASSNDDDAYLVFDENNISRWSPSSNDVPSWVQYAFATPKTIASYQVWRYTANLPSAFTLSGSNDGTAWTVLDTQTGIGSTSPFTYSIASPVSYTYYRLTITAWAVTSDLPLGSVASLRLFEATGTERCATATASSYADQDTADALALAAATAAAQASCDIGNNDLPIQFANGTLAPATPYPSVKVVAGFVGVLAKVTLTLFQVRHFQFDNVGLVLQSPSGTAVMLLWLGDAASQTVVNPAANIIFDDDAATALPDDNPLAGGTYKPTVLESGEAVQFPVPAPTQPYGVVLSDFIGEDPNGNWKLWCIHSGFYTIYNPANAMIIGGFDLTIT